MVRADSKFYTTDVVATAARYDASVSLTTGPTSAPTPRSVNRESRNADKAHRDAQPLLNDDDYAELGIDTAITPVLTDDTDPRTPPTPPRTGVISLQLASPSCSNGRCPRSASTTGCSLPAARKAPLTTSTSLGTTRQTMPGLDSIDALTSRPAAR